MNAAQQGRLLSWHDTLFQQVEQVPIPVYEPIPVGEATELEPAE